MVGHFNNKEIPQTSMKVSRNSYELKNLLNEARYYKNSENPSCIDLILKNNLNSFQKSEDYDGYYHENII